MFLMFLLDFVLANYDIHHLNQLLIICLQNSLERSYNAFPLNPPILDSVINQMTSLNSNDLATS